MAQGCSPRIFGWPVAALPQLASSSLPRSSSMEVLKNSTAPVVGQTIELWEAATVPSAANVGAEAEEAQEAASAVGVEAETAEVAAQQRVEACAN